MQAAYTLTRLMLFGFGWSIAAVLALAAEELLAGVKWPVLGILAALWTFICALYVAGEANRIGAASSASPLPEGTQESSSLRGANGSGLWPAR
jgi:hypothetical protein